MPSGLRHSMRVAWPRSPGMRYVLKRLSSPQLAQYPAIRPGRRRLYELMVGAPMAHSASWCAISPARAWRPSADRPCSSSAAAERVGALRVLQAEVHVQPAAHQVGERPRHERRAPPGPVGELPRQLAEQERVVGRRHRVAVAQRDLHLRGVELAVDAFDRDATTPARLEDLPAEARRVERRTGAVDAVPRDTERLKAVRRVLRQQVELHLEPGHRGEAPLEPAVGGLPQRPPHVDGQLPAVGVEEVGEHDVGVGLPARPTGGQIGTGLHVREADVGAVTGRGRHVTVQGLGEHGDGVVGRVVELVAGHVLAVGQPVEVAVEDPGDLCRFRHAVPLPRSMAPHRCDHGLAEGQIVRYLTTSAERLRPPARRRAPQPPRRG